jgi:hypothetical protein
LAPSAPCDDDPGVPRKNAGEASALALLQQAAEPQSMVCTYQQACAAGLSPGAIRRLVDAGRWHRLHRGVFLIVAGPPGITARMWAAHLALGPLSVVAGAAAGHYWGLLDGEHPSDMPVRMLLEDSIRRTAPGTEVRRVQDPLSRAHPSRQPPVLTVEHAVIDLASVACSDSGAVEVILRSCRLRLTTPDRILRASHAMLRVRRRRLIESVCADARAGFTSPLEIRYHRDVIVPHGLPRGTGQAPSRSVDSGTAYRDILYEEYGVIVELDGRLGHEAESAVFRDQHRDNAATLTGAATLRFGWMAVAGQPCPVAAQVAALLQIRGWPGHPRRCRPGCAVMTAGLRPAA